MLVSHTCRVWLCAESVACVRARCRVVLVETSARVPTGAASCFHVWGCVQKELWPHQREAIAACALWHRRQRSRVLAQFPMGTGKTEVACRVALDFLAARPFGRVLICVSSLAILGQFHRRLSALTRLQIGIEQAQRHAGKERLVVASVSSLRGRLDKYPSQTLLILDEAHHANDDALATLETAKHFDHVLSLTASPWSDGVVEQLGSSERLFLAYSDAASKGMCAQYQILQWAQPSGPFGLVFCKSNAAAKAAAAALPGASWVGIDSGEVSTRLARWRTAQLSILCANRMLWEGFDEPRCAGVWLDRDTHSEIALVQMAGRALRAFPGKAARIYCRTPEQQLRLALAMLRLELPPGVSPRR